MASNFDPWNQTITFRLEDGTPFDISVDYLDGILQYSIRACVNYAAQLGASVILFVILVLLTRAEKRASCLFWLNSLALLLNFARLLCDVLFFTGNFVRIYTLISADESRVTASDLATSIVGAIMTALLLTTIEISLVLQVQVVCSNLRRIYRRALLCVSAVVATATIAIRYSLLAVNIRAILEFSDPTTYNWLESLATVALTISICYFCVIFVTKLGFAIRLRRKLGLSELGPMKVVFIMGCQTLVIPVIVSITHYVSDVPELQTNVLTIVALSLPLSSIWAGTTIDKPVTHSNVRNLWQILSFSGYRPKQSTYIATTTTATTNAKQCTHCYSESRLLTEKESGRNNDTSSKSSSQYGIAVEHDISVRSARRESFDV
uniref:Pheromone receptor PREB n=1 Tax=Emericella nidulans TaxID=162425 RepID=Q7SI72_EMEND|nr:TPA_exp: pheromone receptor PREB [Aspergillus nidulans]